MNSGVAYITIQQFCTFHQCESLVIEEFIDHGIFEVQRRKEVILIPETQVPRIERALRLRTQLGVNSPGIDIILRLLDQLENSRRGAVEDYENYE